MKLNKIFKKDKNILIGAIHFPPLLGYKDFPGFDVAFKNALLDLKSFDRGGVDAVIFENNYDIPHKAFVDSAVMGSMLFLIQKLKKQTSLPIGISVLWNDYKTALFIAKSLGLQFIRIPVFVDKVKTQCGIIDGNAQDVINFRKSINAEQIAIFTDIHVKHSLLLSKHNFVASAKLAIKNKSDGLIVTGNWTGDAPDIQSMDNLRKHIGSFPMIIGSGLDDRNAARLFSIAHAAIVSTSVKSGKGKRGEINVKSYDQRIDIEKVKKLVKTLKSPR
jgi:membrane complex biogenesis BtpA family protein